MAVTTTTDVTRADASVARARQIAHWVGIGIAVACCLFVFWQQRPDLIFRDTTPSGGDIGAHVWWPAYLRDHLLPWRIAGWAPDFYAGFPAGQFYFPLPALLIVGFDLVLPYNIAFKLVTALGPALLPLGAYALGRGFRAPQPTPAAMAVGATGFLFFKGASTDPVAFNQHIMGGNLPSSLAGEFSFTLALAFGLAFLGVLARAFDQRRDYALAAALLAATVLSHLIVALFVVVASAIVWALHRPLRNATVAVAIGGVAALLSAVWAIPLVATLAYTTDTRYEPVEEYVTYLFPFDYLGWAFVLALVAVVAAALEMRRSTLILLLMTATGGLFFRLWEEWGQTPAWNLRFLPFWYLGVYLLAAVGAAELVRGAATLAARYLARPKSDRAPAPTGEGDPAAGPPPKPPRPLVRMVTMSALSVVVALFALWRVDATEGFIPYWVEWNYSGYEETEGTAAKAYPEFRRMIDIMDELPPGRALWEPSGEINRYGTTLAPMLLPYYTDGRIPSMEGVYYEASATSPYHFMAAATLSETPSNNIRGIEYRTIAEFDLGVEWMQALGVRYYMALSSTAKERAAANPSLRLVAEVPDVDGVPPSGWEVYEVADTELVAGLDYEPVVVEGVTPRDWQDDVAVPWFDDPDELNRPLTAGGPSDWQHVPAEDALDAPRRRIDPARVGDIEIDDDSISFSVERIGVPVLVRTSYFPNWQAEGADGPWRATPNFMVVVPTNNEVRLQYATTTGPEQLGRVGTLAGFAGLGGLVWWSRRPRPDAAPAPGAESASDGSPAPDDSPPPPPEGGVSESADVAGR
jgi:6-pyruvoyl-tetrahydropterin synthase related domain